MAVSPEDIERLRRGYAAFNEGGVDAIVGFLGADIELSDRQSAPDRETHHGAAGIWKYFHSTMEAFSDMSLEPLEFIESGDRVVVVLRQLARGRASGVEIEGQVAHVWTIANGVPVQLKIYRDKNAAFEALRS